VEIDVDSKDLRYILLDKEQRNLYLASHTGRLSMFDISDKESPRLIQHTELLNVGSKLTSLVFLTGELSLLAGDSTLSNVLTTKVVPDSPTLKAR
jgi:phosphate transport system permease protein